MDIADVKARLHVFQLILLRSFSLNESEFIALLNVVSDFMISTQLERGDHMKAKSNTKATTTKKPVKKAGAKAKTTAKKLGRPFGSTNKAKAKK